ncbi:hypothetical protein [Hyphomonas oceanitis]|uniref:hypothetical protein n=1 Tax=Hyphomonas oceanitis TaxID=81033 RepID=UPI003001B5C5
MDEAIIRIYDLAALDADEMRRESDRSREAFVLKPHGELERDTAGMFARKMSSLSANELSEILSILNKSENADERK